MIPEEGTAEQCKACVLRECVALPVVWGRYRFAFDRNYGFFTLNSVQSWKVVGMNRNIDGIFCVAFTLGGTSIQCVTLDDWMIWVEQGHIRRLEDRTDDGIDRDMEAWFDYCCHQPQGVVPTYTLRGPGGRIFMPIYTLRGPGGRISSRT